MEALHTEILLEFFLVPFDFTINQKQDVHIDYSCLCYLDLEGNIGHKQEVFAFVGFAGFTICNSKALELVGLLRAEASKKFQLMLNNELCFN